MQSDANHRSRTIEYRRDVDGLRAIAVLAVVAFHLGFEDLEGGFLGVDIFFVISGFLITSILEQERLASLTSIPAGCEGSCPPFS